ncbi:MAG TPA: heme NO-binding domain-containing protein, partial [Vicinamibacteria bacterium]
QVGDDLATGRKGVLAMHGVIFLELRKFVGARLGEGAWDDLIRQSGLGASIYLAAKDYPDAEAHKLVEAACSVSGRSSGELLEDFGEFVVPDLLQFYGSQLDPAWKTLDVIENTEETIHKVVRRRNPGVKPPELRCERPSPDEVVVRYTSARRMCALAKGICTGLAVYFGERIAISESACMLAGAPECRISVRRL